MLEDSIKEISRQIPDLHSQIFNAKKELDLSRRQIDIMKIEHLSQIKGMKEQHKKDLMIKQQEKVQMRKDFDVEYDLLQCIIKQKDTTIEELRDALEKMMRMLKYPRLVTLLNRQLNYERVEFAMPKRSRSPDLMSVLV